MGRVGQFRYTTFHFTGDEANVLDKFPGFKQKVADELIRCSGAYTDELNAKLGILNDRFDQSHPGYFERNAGKDYTELTEYNQFLADSAMRYIVNRMNARNESELLELYVDPVECTLCGKVKGTHVTVSYSAGEPIGEPFTLNI